MRFILLSLLLHLSFGCAKTTDTIESNNAKSADSYTESVAKDTHEVLRTLDYSLLHTETLAINNKLSDITSIKKNAMVLGANVAFVIHCYPDIEMKYTIIIYAKENNKQIKNEIKLPIHTSQSISPLYNYNSIKISLDSVKNGFIGDPQWIIDITDAKRKKDKLELSKYQRKYTQMNSCADSHSGIKESSIIYKQSNFTSTTEDQKTVYDDIKIDFSTTTENRLDLKITALQNEIRTLISWDDNGMLTESGKKTLSNFICLLRKLLMFNTGIY